MCVARIVLFTVSVWIICEFSCTSAGPAGSSNKKCPPLPAIRHGKIQYMQKRRFARIQCVKGYMLAGNKVAICTDGQWEEALPKCVKPTCSKIKSPENGLSYALPDLQGAVVKFFCLYGYNMRGRSTTSCNGTHWDNPLPVCQKSGTLPQTECDFETDMCGWNPDLNHDFDWMRYRQRTSSRLLDTGPGFDHTKGPGGAGYYMYIESLSRIVNDTARLISPVFGRPAGCIELYYHMYGRSIGALNVYVLSLSVLRYRLSNLPKPIFSRSGNQGDAWLRALIPLDDVTTPFQVIVEGVRGENYLSDIAIDDFKLMDSCPVEETDTTTEDFMNSSEITNYAETEAASSCVNRCNNDTVSTFAVCQCTDSCILDYTCCPDFIVACNYDQFAANDSTVTYETESVPDEYVYTDGVASTTKTENATTVRVTATTATTTRATDATTTTTTTRSTTTTRRAAPAPAPTTKTTTTTGRPAVVRTTATTSKQPPKTSADRAGIVTKQTTIRTTASTRTIQKNGMKNVTKYVPVKNATRPVKKPDFSKTINKVDATAKVATKPDKSTNDARVKNDTGRKDVAERVPKPTIKPAIRIDKATAQPKPKPNAVDVDDVAPFPTTTTTDASTRASRTYAFYTKQAPPALAPVESRAPADGRTRAAVWVTVVVAIALVALIATLAMRRYRCASGININKLKKHRCSTDSVSDVRFLTSDEILDFTLARPADETDSLL